MRACDIENRRVIMSTLNDEKIKGYLYREYGVETTSIPRNNELRIHFKSVRRNSEPYTAAKQVKSLFKPLGNVWENIKSNLHGSELVLVFNRRNSEEISHNLSKLKGGKERWMQRHDLDEDAKLEAYEALEEFRSKNIPDALMSMREGNQYFANGEVFPTYEDARNELEREEELNTQNEINYQIPSDRNVEEFVASEKTIRDLAARMSDRIGIPVRFESDRTKEYKGKLETFPGGTRAVINLAYATLDTPIHEILGHPIIRAIKDKSNPWRKMDRFELDGNFYIYDVFSGYTKEGKTISKEEYIKAEQEFHKKHLSNNQLYQNLLKELEYGKGKEVLDRIKRDYVYKEEAYSSPNQKIVYKGKESRIIYLKRDFEELNNLSYEEIFNLREKDRYTLEEQQEEALVELLGLYTAGRLDKVKDGKLISLLKRLLKEMKQFVRSLLNQKEVEIDKLPDNMTLGDIADLLAYSNSKIILPGNEVVYTTPDNRQFKTYTEASKHISNLAKSVEDVDLSDVDILKEIEENDYFVVDDDFGFADPFETSKDLKVNSNPIVDFIDKNKQYEQSKEIIEEWKKVNNIQYNPEEVYSRGQEFVSVVGAYSDFDVNLMMQNLLQHIEDNQKAGGEFTISAFTKPIDRQIGHLEGGGGKIKFKIYPQSQDIKWASNTDVYSGSVWDASEKVSKDKKSELLGVSYTKYPSLANVNTVQPNLAAIIDNLAHHHNELGISLTGNNFRLEYDNNIPYSTKKIIDSINSILDQKYGKLVKPEIKIDGDIKFALKSELNNNIISIHNTEEEARIAWKKLGQDRFTTKITKSRKYSGIQPTQTNETLKESIESVKLKYIGGERKIIDEFGQISYEPFDSEIQKEYTEQALINLRIAKLKEVAKKYPRSLIRSEVRPIPRYEKGDEYYEPFKDELPFQKVRGSSLQQFQQKTFSPNYLFTKDWNIKVPEVILETNDSNSDFNLSCIKK